MSYSPTLGRWMEQDPADYADGANRYQVVESSPVMNMDPSGTLTWRNGATKYITEDVIKASPSKYIDYWPQPGVGAATQPRLHIETTFYWLLKWKISLIDITFYNEIHQLPEETERALGVDPEWGKQAEQDHVNDMEKWAREVGEPLARRLEIPLLKMCFRTVKEGDSVVDEKLVKPLASSMENALLDSRMYWDAGPLYRHTPPLPGQDPF